MKSVRFTYPYFYYYTCHNPACVLPDKDTPSDVVANIYHAFSRYPPWVPYQRFLSSLPKLLSNPPFSAIELFLKRIPKVYWDFVRESNGKSPRWVTANATLLYYVTLLRADVDSSLMQYAVWFTEASLADTGLYGCDVPILLMYSADESPVGRKICGRRVANFEEIREYAKII